MKQGSPAMQSNEQAKKIAIDYIDELCYYEKKIPDSLYRALNYFVDGIGVPVGIAKIAKKYGLSVIAFCGCVSNGAVICNQHGIDAFFPILRAITSAEDAMNPDIAKKNLANTAEQVFHLYHINRKETLD